MLPRTDGYPLEICLEEAGQTCTFGGHGLANSCHLAPGPTTTRQSGDPDLQISARLAASRQPSGIFRQHLSFPALVRQEPIFQSSSELGHRHAGVQRVSSASTVLAWTIIHPVDLLCLDHSMTRSGVFSGFCSSRSRTEQGPPEYPCGAPSAVYL